MAYGTILVVCYTKTVVFKITGFPTIITYRVRAVGFEMTGLTVAAIKLRSFFKRTIGVYIAGGQTKMVF